MRGSAGKAGNPPQREPGLSGQARSLLLISSKRCLMSAFGSASRHDATTFQFVARERCPGRAEQVFDDTAVHAGVHLEADHINLIVLVLRGMARTGHLGSTSGQMAGEVMNRNRTSPAGSRVADH